MTTAPPEPPAAPATPRPTPPRPPKAAIERGADGAATVRLPPEARAAAFGTDDPGLAGLLATQLLRVLHADAEEPVAPGTVEAALALLRAVAPRDGLEGLLAVQMVACQVGALETARRALHPDQTPAGRALYANLATRLMRTFAAQLEALHRGRGEGTVQRVVVERVNVAEGGQAVVGAVAAGRGARGDG